MKTPLLAAVVLTVAAATPAAARPIEEVGPGSRVVIETAAPMEVLVPAGKTVNGESDGSGAPARARGSRLGAYPTGMRAAAERGL